MINKIITEHGLSVGDTMINTHGEQIKDSVVLSNYSVLYRNERDGYTLMSESPLRGETTTVSLSDEAVATIKRITF